MIRRKLEHDLEQAGNRDLLAEPSLVRHEGGLRVEGGGVLLAQRVVRVQVPVVKRGEDLEEPGELRVVQGLDDGMRDELGEVVEIFAQERGEREISREISARRLREGLGRDEGEVEHAVAVELGELLLGLVVLRAHVVVRRRDGRVGGGHGVERPFSVAHHLPRLRRSTLVHVQQGDVHAEVEDRLLVAVLPLLRDLLHHLLHESDRRRAIGVPRRHRDREVPELDWGDPVLKVHQEVVVELDEEVALLERRQRDSLLELHRELMPQLALVEAPELGEELGELGLLARLPVEEGVNLSGAAHRSRL
mmetsp:Transcript_9792/g.38229  ORF Transcript_9792/g.38229 Transcript_9792/m.38229 type:complete len:306 (-) Transcript_9792:150-1067(-)